MEFIANIDFGNLLLISLNLASHLAKQEIINILFDLSSMSYSDNAYVPEKDLWLC